MLSRKTAWREAAWIFGVSRLALLIITALALRFPLAGQTVSRNCANGSDCFLTTWYHWDVGAYASVAAQGYSSLHDTVFFPLWPLLLRGVGSLFGGSLVSYYVAGLLLANIFFYLALVIFYCLLAVDFDAAIARNALFYLSFAPYGLYFFAGYTESLFLLLCLLVFFCLQHERWWLAGLCGFLAALTRSQGVLLVVPFMVVLVRRFWLHREQTTWQQKLRVCFPALLVPLGVMVFMVYLAITKHDPLAFSTQEAVFWRRHLTIPLISIVAAFQALFHLAWLEDLFLLNFLDIASVIAVLALLAVGWKQLPLHYNLFALALILFNISYPQGVVEPLTAAPRYMVIVFPVYVVLATWGSKQPRIDRIITVCSLLVFTINTILFISHFWVA